MIKIVHNRIDALVMAYRVRIDYLVSEAMRKRGALALEHGRAAIDVGALTWELRYSRTPRRWNLTRFDHVRALVDLSAPGAMLSYTPKTHIRSTGEVFASPTRGNVELYDRIDTFEECAEPGWTLELVYYAQYLADHSLESCIKEAREIASTFGRPFEERVRRLDLACDVQGFRIRERDRQKLVTRSALRMDPKRSQVVELTKDDDAGTATMHARRAITGLTVGKGPMLCRIYDKQEELRVGMKDAENEKDRATMQAKTIRELERWRAGGWDGVSPVARVEFQLRGEPLRSLGIRAAHNIVEPLTTCAPPGVNLGTGEIYDLPDYIPRIWSTCIQWLRLVVRTRSRRTGEALQKTRWKLDPRWRVLHEADWGRKNAIDKVPIKRARVRAPVSAAQAIGAMASLVAARGGLELQDENPESYKENASEKLMTMLRVLCFWGIDHMAADLITRWGSPEKAAAHLAIRLNAARARFPLARGSPKTESEGKQISWLANGQPESEKLGPLAISPVTSGEPPRQEILNWGSS